MTGSVSGHKRLKRRAEALHLQRRRAGLVVGAEIPHYLAVSAWGAVRKKLG